MPVDVIISDQTLSVDKAMEFTADETCGGHSIFVGTVRNVNKGESVTHLSFDSYDEMALKEMEKIAQASLDKFQTKKIAIHHRKGEVRIGDIAVVIAVSSMHRDAAFEACRYAIDQLKKSVPIWKKEFLMNGSHWINATP